MSAGGWNEDDQPQVLEQPHGGRAPVRGPGPETVNALLAVLGAVVFLAVVAGVVGLVWLNDELTPDRTIGDAASQCDFAGVEEFLADGSKPDDALPQAVDAPCGTEMLEFHLAAGADVNYEGRGLWDPALHEAASEGDLAARVLLDAGADPNLASSYDGETAVHKAAWENQPEVAELLLDHGADPDTAATDYGSTPLQIAVGGGSAEMARVLLDGGADPNAPGRQGVTPLHEAITKRSRVATTTSSRCCWAGAPT